MIAKNEYGQLNIIFGNGTLLLSNLISNDSKAIGITSSKVKRKPDSKSGENIKPNEHMVYLQFVDNASIRRLIRDLERLAKFRRKSKKKEDTK